MAFLRYALQNLEHQVRRNGLPQRRLTFENALLEAREGEVRCTAPHTRDGPEMIGFQRRTTNLEKHAQARGENVF